VENLFMDFVEKYIDWKQSHPYPGYQYDNIDNFFDELNRSQKQELMEYLIFLKDQLNNTECL